MMPPSFRRSSETEAKDLMDKTKLQGSACHVRKRGGRGEAKDRGGAYRKPARRPSQDQKADQKPKVLAEFKKNR